MVLRGLRFGSKRPAEEPDDNRAQPDQYEGASEAPTQPASKAEDLELRAAQLEISRIEEALRELDPEPAKPKDDPTVSLPLRLLLSLLPGDSVTGDAANAPEEMVSIAVPDMIGQLRAGRIEARMADLVLGIPQQYIAPDSPHSGDTPITLPLATVVGALDPSVLAGQVAAPAKPSLADSLPDPFADPGEIAAAPTEPAPPAAEPALPTEVEPPAEAPAAEPAPVAAPEEPAPPVTEPVTDDTPPTIPEPKKAREIPDIAVPAAPPDKAARVRVDPATLVASHEERALSRWDRLHCVDVNSAAREELLALEGVTRTVADAIVEYRASHGPLRTVFALRGIPRVGRVTFRKMTGMGYSQGAKHRITRLLRLLDLTIETAPHLPTVMEKMSQQNGFSGALLSDSDGLLLAQAGADDCGEALSAVMPLMFNQLARNMAEIGFDSVRSVSLCSGDRMFTIARAGRLYLTALHGRRKLTKAQLTLIERVADEMSWLLSKRAFAGTASEDPQTV